MSPTVPVFGEALWELPPLILHPFNERLAPAALLENSRAALMLSGLIANDGTDPETLRRRLLSGRHAETRMLFFLGKDLLRWVEQCVEFTGRIPELEQAQIRPQSFARLLTVSPPEPVKAKLTVWGVADHSVIFSRALGLNALFCGPPEFEVLSEEFLHSYHRYADSLYRCYMESETHAPLTSANFHFELYASGEYSRLLESEWGADGA